ncbi:LytTR family DNA-binding domain-containing protein [Reichenbachiella sp. MALMAid0571]|uniref:LytR/AlgR family response regulator transcription factor n=1 Tax=Reichenbachiella sp. MALMAid0571 TaxID=3143939 RepID=UPI0032DF5F81
MTALIIEDEIHAQKELKRLLESSSHGVEVLDCIDTVEDSIEWLQNNPKPDLIFLDVQLSDGLSFEIFKQVEVESPIIFTTAFENYALKAFKVNSIDYLLKPIEIDKLEASLDKYSKLRSTFSGSTNVVLNSEQVDRLFEITTDGKKEYKKRFMVKTGDRIRHISVQDTAFFLSEHDYTYLVAKENKKFIIDYSLDELAKILDPNEFFRISRKCITNIHSVKMVNKYFNSRLEVILQPPTEDQILISRVRVPEFMKWLEK